jgi:hypothetical protein
VNPRLAVALGAGGVAAAVALVFGIVKQLGVKSYGHPAGPVVRAGQHLGVLIETRDPFIPSLKGRDERDMSYSYTLWLIPESGVGDIRTIRLDRGVASGSRVHTIGAKEYDNGILWLSIEGLQGIDLASEKKTTQPAPASLVNAPILRFMGEGEFPLKQFRAQSVMLASGDWLFLVSDDEVKASLQPGTRLYDDSATAEGTPKPRGLHVVKAAPGVIPTIGSAARRGDHQLRNGAFMRSAKGGSVVRFSDPDGFLVVHDQGDPVHPSIHLSRLNADGSVAWTADTKIGRLNQVLPHERLPVFVGELPRTLTEPMLAVVDLKDGTARTKSLKGPLNECPSAGGSAGTQRSVAPAEVRSTQ